MPLAEFVSAPRAFDDIARILEPDTAYDNIGIAVFVDISKSNCLAMGAVNNLLGPLAVLLLSPEMDSIAGFVPEFGLVPRDDVQIPVAIKITEFYIVRGVSGDFVRFPGPAGRIAARPRILIPEQASHDDVEIAVFIDVAEFTVDGPVATIYD
jgi:hypothetical protein